MTNDEMLEQIRDDQRELATCVRICWNSLTPRGQTDPLCKRDMQALARLVALAKKGAERET